MTHFFCAHCFRKFDAPESNRAPEFCSPRCKRAQAHEEQVEQWNADARERDCRHLYVKILGGKMRRDLGLSEDKFRP